MRDLRRLKAAYDAIDDLIQQRMAEAVRRNDVAAEQRLNETRDILDRAFFVLCFGQFEVGVNEVFERARDRRAGQANWTRRRGWDLDDYRNMRVRFEDRLALVLDRRKPDYGKILDRYSTRNHVAHGGLKRPVGSIDQLVNELFAWHSQLRD